ncbi:uncharacterized protein LOC141641339 [Silene latifolia]|uniref:uncharacterized protein LOC141641339 n=1 Tax=Silene latifolia TaxID=37657 RepID=UPI003D779DDD
MKNIAACYSEHAVKVSDSYCSGPLNKSYISPKSIPSTQNHVTYTYKSNLSNQKRLFITITWSNKLIYQGFFIKISEKISKPSNSQHGLHQITKIHGSKSLLLDSRSVSKVDIHWDLSKARFEPAGPTPIEGFYLVIVLVDSQIAFVLGDMKECKIVENLVKGLIKPKITLISQCEQFTGQWNNQINSKAKFCDYGIEHDIMIKCGPEDDGPRNPVLSIYVDNKRVVRVKKLQWNFRGNQVIFVDNLLVDVMWDVFNWYLDQNVGLIGRDYGDKIKGGSGLFMFRTRSGLDSRLWLIEEEKKLTDKNDEKPHFSLLICASSKNPG